jgi:hypothetical protein
VPASVSMPLLQLHLLVVVVFEPPDVDNKRYTSKICFQEYNELKLS